MHTQEQQPIFKLPPGIFLLTLIISIIALLGLWLDDFSVFLGRYCALNIQNLTFENSYTLLSYSLIHGDYTHLGMNMLWLVIFGTPIERFFGIRSLLIIFVLGVISGGLIFLTYDNQAFVIGASAGVSACTGAALRFMLKPAFDFNNRPQLYRLTDGRFLLPSIIIFIVDIIHALFMAENGYNIAWQSHIIGYIMGAILMELFVVNHGAIKRNKLTPNEETYLGD